MQPSVLKWHTHIPCSLALTKTHFLYLSLSVCSSTLPLPTMRLEPPVHMLYGTDMAWKVPASSGDLSVCHVPTLSWVKSMRMLRQKATRGECHCPHCPCGLQQDPRILEERRQLKSRWDEPSWPVGFRFALGTCSLIRVRNHFRIYRSTFSESESQYLWRCGVSGVTMDSTVLTEIPDTLKSVQLEFSGQLEFSLQLLPVWGRFLSPTIRLIFIFL